MPRLDSYSLGIRGSGSEFLALSPSGRMTLVLTVKLPRLAFLICKMEMLIVSKMWLLWGLMRWYIYSVNKKLNSVECLLWVQGSVLSAWGMCMPLKSQWLQHRCLFLLHGPCSQWISYNSAPFLFILRPKLRSCPCVEHTSKGKRAMPKMCTRPLQSRGSPLGQCVEWL